MVLHRIIPCVGSRTARFSYYVVKPRSQQHEALQVQELRRIPTTLLVETSKSAQGITTRHVAIQSLPSTPAATKATFCCANYIPMEAPIFWR